MTLHKSYSELIDDIEKVIENYPNITHKEIIGNSSWGKKINVIKIGWNIKEGRPLLKPMVKIVANMHGDETMGMELMLLLIRLVFLY